MDPIIPAEVATQCQPKNNSLLSGKLAFVTSALNTDRDTARKPSGSGSPSEANASQRKRVTCGPRDNNTGPFCVGFGTFSVLSSCGLVVENLWKWDL